MCKIPPRPLQICAEFGVMFTAIEEIMAEVGSFSYKIPGHEIDRRYRIKQVEAGIIPNLYEKRLPFIHAHSFLYAVDCVGKIIEELAGFEGVSEGVQTCDEKFNKSFPSVRKIRNSALHIEDRLQGYGPVWDKRKGKKMGVGLSLSDLVGNNLRYTIDDGSQQSFEISPDTLNKLIELVNLLLASLEWSGHSKLLPNF